jgi:branched-chain amino acid transport system substrate-binding protein
MIRKLKFSSSARFLLGFVISLSIFSGCQSKTSSVKIAVALPLTGDIASLGQGLKRSVVMAVENANASKELPFPIEIVAFDDRSDPKEAVSVANRIVADRDVVAVIGHFNSGCSIPASRVYAGTGLPMISPASSNPQLTEQQLSPQWTWPKCIFRVNTTDNVQGAYGADFVFKGLKAKKAAIIHDKTAYGQGVAEVFKKQFEATGGQVTAYEGLQLGDRDFRSLLTRIKGTQPEALYFGGMFSEGGILVRQARDIGFKGYFVACEANYDPAFLRVAGDAATGAYVTFLGSPPDLLPSAKDFVEQYKKRYPTDELKSYDHYGYEVGMLVIDALKKVGPNREKIIEYLRGVKFNGVLGSTSFDEKGDTLNKTITLFVVKKGNFEPYAWTPAP